MTKVCRVGIQTKDYLKIGEKKGVHKRVRESIAFMLDMVEDVTNEQLNDEIYDCYDDSMGNLTISVRLPVEVHERVKQEAKRRGITQTQLTRILIRLYNERMEEGLNA